MKIFKRSIEIQAFIERQKEMGKKVGFAPTMGALHAGHISLYAAARRENDLVISSIFVNPTQFNNASDLEQYPRDVESDLEVLKKSGLVDVVYIPEVADIYPDGLKSKAYHFGGIENEMEGKFRPGHFNGVGTVVEELFRQIKPNNAYFGEKDYQQLAVIRKLAAVAESGIHIHGVPIFREPNGLAMSSRNQRLSADQKTAAKIIYETLQKVNDWFRIITIPEINLRVRQIFEAEKGMELEYFEIADEETLKETDFFYKDRNYRAFIVVFVGDIRLIDNIHLD